MTSDIYGVAEYVSETAEGQATVVAALVMTLHKAGTLPLDSFRDTLKQLWASMPEDKAMGDAGAVIEQMIEFLNSDACSSRPAVNEAPSSDRAPDADKPSRDDAAAASKTGRIARFVNTAFETASRPLSDVSGSTRHGTLQAAVANRL